MTTPSADEEATARVETDAQTTPRSRGRVEQFTPGAIIAGRYRISAILGAGGMGEVYRADDLKLDQPVALKFLPARLARDPLLLGRLHDEVRLGRQIAHPNVCRIYDIVDWENAHFVAMEYVDGEDLSRLLRRIGRLPHDKAIDIARGIAAGLMAAHAKGILHRDLKPANVMLDSRGDARIMDFGLAFSSTEDQGGEVSGTPAYMAPEQLQGAPASVQSDLYALGLVMYELFTGKRAHAGKTLPDRVRELTSEITTPSSHIHDIDPLVERVILRCLASEPAQRPRSAREVIEALPGGDPLAAAMAAGETPSPRIVAAAGAEGSLRRGVAWTLLAAAMLFAITAVFVLRRNSYSHYVPFDRSPEVLEDRAQIIARDLGVPIPGNPVRGIYQRLGYEEWLVKRDRARVGEAFRKGPGPILLRMEHGVLPQESALEPLLASAPGRTSIDVDTAGRLSFLLVAPESEVSPRPLDWKKLLDHAGLSLATIKATEPRHAPPVPFDARAAWSGTYAGDDTPIRVEAAAWHGMPVFFRVTGDWEPKAALPTPPAPAMVVLFASIVLIAVAVVLAWRNYHFRRGDRVGALRAGIAICVIAWISDLLTASYPGDPFQVIRQAFQQINSALGAGLIAYVIYLGIEPALRRRWPDRLIAWSRLIAGRFTDPMVGRDTLIGVVAGTAYAILSATSRIVARLTSSGSQTPNLAFPMALLGVPSTIGSIAQSLIIGAFIAFILMTLLVVATMVLRNRIAAVAVLFAGTLAVFLAARSLPLPTAIASAALVTWIPYRYGLLATAVFVAVHALLYLYPCVATPWATSLAAIAYAAFAALAIWAFKTSLGGQSAFGEIAD
jgi:serine/threonine-protein kinase